MTKPDYQQIALLLTDPSEISNRELARWLCVSEAQIRKAKKYALERKKDQQNSGLQLNEVRTILEDALSLKANAGGAIKAEIRRALDLLNYKSDLL